MSPVRVRGVAVGARRVHVGKIRRLGAAFGGRAWLALTGSLLPELLWAADTNDGPERIPSLEPPRGEIAPGFWEQYAVWVALGSLVFVALMTTLVWYLRRPRPPVVVPPEVVARRALEQLRNQPEDGAVLSRVSQVLRHYVAEVANLPEGELTTAEFCGAMDSQPRLGDYLSAALSDFLRQCDERKFAPRRSETALGAVDRALELVEAARARLVQPPT